MRINTTGWMRRDETRQINGGRMHGMGWAGIGRDGMDRDYHSMAFCPRENRVRYFTLPFVPESPSDLPKYVIYFAAS